MVRIVLASILFDSRQVEQCSASSVVRTFLVMRLAVSTDLRWRITDPLRTGDL